MPELLYNGGMGISEAIRHLFEPNKNADQASLAAQRSAYEKQYGRNQRIKLIPENYERQCKYCGSTGPCTPKNLPCGQCGRNLKGGKRIRTSNFDSSAY